MANTLMIYERMNELQLAARALQASGYFTDVKSEAQAIVKVMAGAELGLPPFASMAGIHIVQGKPVLGANLIATLVKNDPRYNYRVKQADNTACVLTWYEDGQPVGESSFTMVEANAAGLGGKDNWKKYASDMLFARALTRGARRYAPGIFGGAPVYTPDELNVETDEDGHIIRGEIVEVTTANPNPSGLLYADGSFVDNNPKAIETYNAYREAHNGNAPDNVHNLRNWFKAQNGKQPAPAAEAPEQTLFPVSNGAYEEA